MIPGWVMFILMLSAGVDRDLVCSVTSFEVAQETSTIPMLVLGAVIL